MERYDVFNPAHAIPEGEGLDYRSLQEIAKQLANVMVRAKREGRPLVIALDGMPGLGKSTVVNAAMVELKKRHKKVAVVHLDDFLSRNSVRHATKTHSDVDPGINYFENNVRYHKFKQEVLVPLMQKGELKGVRMGYNFHDDADTTMRQDDIDGNTFVIVEGAMSIRDDLRQYYDLTILLSGPLSLAEQQALNRNNATNSDKKQKSHEEMLVAFRERYWAGYKRHIEKHCALAADIVVTARKSPDKDPHEVEYAFQTVKPMDEISRGGK